MPDGVTAAHADDVTLLRALHRGDGNAAAAAMRRHNQTLWRIARGILHDDHEAEEVVQDTWLRAFAAARDYRGEAGLGTWLARIAINEALRRADRRTSTVELDPVADVLPTDHPGSATMPPAAGPEHAAARAEIRRMLEQAIDALAPPYRVVFMMRVVEQMSIEETATALEIPAATVKTRLHRANERLRATIGDTFATVLEGAFPFGGTRCARLTDAVLARLDIPRASAKAD
ncbi:MAG TPA: RNA polymerase sigma factor [Acetobacteraceae bacterium]|jgi:RNA polymerase sigma-70 factor (ECF subfamily)